MAACSATWQCTCTCTCTYLNAASTRLTTKVLDNAKCLFTNLLHVVPNTSLREGNRNVSIFFDRGGSCWKVNCAPRSDMNHPSSPNESHRKNWAWFCRARSFRRSACACSRREVVRVGKRERVFACQQYWQWSVGEEVIFFFFLHPRDRWQQCSKNQKKNHLIIRQLISSLCPL
jgi:hypothetical protein